MDDTVFSGSYCITGNAISEARKVGAQSMAQQITAHLKRSAAPGPKPAMAEVRITPEPNARTLPVIDSKLTIVSPGKAPLATSSDDEAVNALLCYGCHTLEGDEDQDETT